MDWINKLLKDNETLRDIRTAVLILIPFIMAFIWWGFLDNINFGNFKWETVTALSLIATVGIFNSRVDSRVRGKEDTILTDLELGGIEKDIQGVNFPLDDDFRALDIVSNMNNKLQTKANKIKTNLEIERLKVVARNKIKRNKNAKGEKEKIEYLKKEGNELIDTRITHFTYADIVYVNSNDKKKNRIVDGKFIQYDSAKDGNKRSILITSIKGIGLGGMGVGFLWNTPWKVWVSFFVGLLLSMAMTYLIQYMRSVKQTGTKYKEARKEKLNLMNYVKGELEKPIAVKEEKIDEV